MNLFILRHGDTNNATEGQKDFDRTLSETGILHAVKIGDFLKDKSIGQIISSQGVRAQETAEIVNQFIKTDYIDFDEQLYLADSATILNTITNLGLKQNLLFVGHNFGISDFASDLIGEHLTLDTCMLLEIELTVDNWELLSSSTGILTQITDAKHL
jgi:phosphohistidine phosphatase